MLCTTIETESHLKHATPSQIQSVRATCGHLEMLSVVCLFRNWMQYVDRMGWRVLGHSFYY